MFGIGSWKQYVWPKCIAAAGSMSGGHQLQLAALWPWLLMATLQAGFGRTGLVLGAAVESERSAEQKAIIRVIPLKMDPTGKLNLTLEGVFAGVAEITPAEGKLMQEPKRCCYEELLTSSEDGNITGTNAKNPGTMHGDPVKC